MGQLSVRRSAAWSLAGNSVYALGQWLLIVALARMGSLETVGRFSLALAVTGPLFMAANMRLRLVQAADATHEHPFRAYFVTRVLSSCLATTAACVIAMTSSGQSCVMHLIFALAVAKAVEALQDIVLGRFQQQERMDLAAASMIASAVLSAIGFVLTFHLSANLVAACVVMAAVRVGVLVAYDLPRSARTAAACSISPGVATTVRGSFAHAGAIVAIAWPLGVAALMDSLTVNVPRYFVGGLLGDEQLGAFTALVQIALAGFVVVNALGQSVMPRLARQLANEEHIAFRKLAHQFFFSSALIGVAGIGAALFFGQLVLQLLYGSSFDGYARVFLLVMIGAAFSYLALALVLVLTVLGWRRIQTGLYCVNVTVTLAGCAAWVPNHGLQAAAMAVMTAHAVQVALSFWLLRSLKPWKLRNDES